MARGKKNNVPDEERDATGDAVFSVGDYLAGGSIIFTILILGGTYFVCPPGVTDTGMCMQVTRLGLTSFIAQMLGLTGIVGLTVQRIMVRVGNRDHITTISVNSSSDQ